MPVKREGYKDRHRTSFELRRSRVLEYLRQYPYATWKDITEAGLQYDFWIAYGERIQEARRDAGYVSGAEVARILGISRDRVSRLFASHKLDGHRMGRSILISLASVENRQQKKKS